MNILVIGSGTMGSGIAQVFATNGYDVYLSDIKQEFVDKGYSNIKKNLNKLVEKGKMSADGMETIANRVHPTLDLSVGDGCGWFWKPLQKI